MQTFFPDESPLRYWISRASVSQIACTVSWPPLIAVTGYAPCVRAWSPTSRDEPEFKPVPQLLEVDGERFVACTVKGDLLVAADASSSGRISVWDTSTWARQQTLTAGAPVTSLDASRTYIAAGTAAGYVRVWKRQSAADATFTQFFVPDLQLDSLPVQCVRLGPLRPAGPGGGGGGGGAGGGGGGGGGDGGDCMMVVHTRGNGRVSAWRMSDAKIIGTLGRGGGGGGGGAPEPADAVLAANALHTCLAKGHLLIVSWLPGRDPLLQYVHPIQRMGGEIPGVKQHLEGVARPLSCDYDGDVVVMGCEDGMVWVWGLLQGYGPQPQPPPPDAAQRDPPVSHWRGYHAGAVGAVACLPHRGQIASGGADGCVKLWSSTGQLLSIARLGWQVTSMALNELALVVGGAEGQLQLLLLLAPGEDSATAAAVAAARPTEADRAAAAAPTPVDARAEYDYWFDARSPKAASSGSAGSCGRAAEQPEAFAAFVTPRRHVTAADLQPQPGGGGASAGDAGASSGSSSGPDSGSSGGPAGEAGAAPGGGAASGRASGFNMQAALKGAHRNAADQAAAQAAEEEARRAQLRAMGENPGVARSRAAVQLEGATAALGRKCSNPSCLQREGVAALQQGGGGAGAGFKRCGACKSVLYCSAHCQSTHWRDGHKKECAKLAEAWRQQQLQQQQQQQEEQPSVGSAAADTPSNGGDSGGAGAGHGKGHDAEAASPRVPGAGSMLQNGGGGATAARGSTGTDGDGVLTPSTGNRDGHGAVGGSFGDCLNELD
ncbi:hypothetical protein GPECTOR_2g1535 [Gonium pectorale]|uniref:MYND-type domain-containing protein n=1 Tax=Gonium pectorale TaxID=33097 RepID=A0A150H1U1_GONPE|nr:hypothetical protein GPECTOR_2g1535 [Gonium pectorale]|eukprot:KXZ55983.1 hypothetical protein GPECTOR_2g1535 [Gonium pectorale]